MTQPPSNEVSNAARLRRALGCGVVIGLVPIVFFGLTMLPTVMRGDNSTAVAMVLIAMFVVAFFFGVPAAMLMYAVQLRPGVRRPTLADAYRDFAEQVSGQAKFQKLFLGVEFPKEVRFRHNERMAVLDLPHSHEPGGKGFGVVRMTFDLPQSRRLTCQIYPQGLLSPLGSVFGAQDATFGWDVFDDHFVVKTNDPPAAASVFDRSIKEWLLRFKSFADQRRPPGKGPRSFEIALTEKKFELRMRAMMSNKAELMDFYQACAEIYELVEARLEKVV